MKKQDLTEYSDQELSLMVFNDEDLYRMRRSFGFVEYLREVFIFTDDQLEVLKVDLREDAES